MAMYPQLCAVDRKGCSRRFRSVFRAEEDFAAGRDLCVTGLITPVAILSQLHTRFAFRRKSFPTERTYFNNQRRLYPTGHWATACIGEKSLPEFISLKADREAILKELIPPGDGQRGG